MCVRFGLVVDPPPKTSDDDDDVHQIAVSPQIRLLYMYWYKSVARVRSALRSVDLLPSV